jgi:hypothetical protein
MTSRCTVQLWKINNRMRIVIEVPVHLERDVALLADLFPTFRHNFIIFKERYDQVEWRFDV